MPQPKAPDDIVVESGPVQYDAEDGPHHEDEGEDEYYDEEDDHLQSAAQLMGHRGRLRESVVQFLIFTKKHLRDN